MREINQAAAKQIQEGFKKIVESYPTAEQVALNLKEATKDLGTYAQVFITQKETSKCNAIRSFLNKVKR